MPTIKRTRYVLQVWRRGKWRDVSTPVERKTAKNAVWALHRFSELDWRAVRREVSDCGR
jgi:hypothetical protein